MSDAAIRTDQPKVDPESLVLRAKPRGVTRFKRHVVIGIAAIVSVAVSVAAWLALSAPALHVTTNGAELLNVDRKPAADGLASLPATYDKVKPPALGPPLPGDLGPPIFAQRGLGASPTDGANPEEAARADQMHVAQLTKQAQEGGVFFQVASNDHGVAGALAGLVADGRILDSTRSGNQIRIDDPVANKWTVSGTMPLQSGDENSWASLQNGGVLAVGYQSDGAAIYNPATGKWIRTGPVPSGFNTGDTGGISQMFDGRVFVYGLSGQSYIYTPGATAADPGAWVAGPKMLNGDEAEDEFSDTLPNGKVWGGLVTMTYGPGVVLQQFDPTTNMVSSATPPPDQGNPYPIGYVNLPNGQVMVTAANQNWIYTPSTPPMDAWRPTVTSVVYNSDGSYTLTGTQISGLINGADEGDDMTMAENYPIVSLRDEAGNVYYCRSFAFSNMMPSKGPTPETCQFTTPKNLPEGTYDLYVSAVGVQSKDGVPFTVGVGTTGGSGDAGGAAADAGGTGDDGSTDETDAGTPSGGASSSSSGAGSENGAGTDAGGGAAGQGDTPTGKPSPRGCACHAGGESSRRVSPAWLVVAGLVLAGWRRRKARRT